MEKGENAGNQHSLLFPQCFLPHERQKLHCSNMSSANAFDLEQSKNLLFGKQSAKNPLVRLSLLGKTWSGQVDFPSLSNCRTSAKWQANE